MDEDLFSDDEQAQMAYDEMTWMVLEDAISEALDMRDLRAELAARGLTLKLARRKA